MPLQLRSQSPSYRWPVVVEFPVDGGKFDKETFDAENNKVKRKATDGDSSERDAKRRVTQPAGYQGQGKSK